VTCLEVRDRLVERSLGALPLEDVREVDRHLAWCAGCRKEAAELDRAAATFALTLAPEVPPAELEGQVVTAVLAAADAPGARRPPRRGRSVAASMIAAMIAVSALGWGTAMAGRAERFRERAQEAQVEQFDAISSFKKVIDEAAVDPANRVYLGTLAPPAGRLGGGSALTLVSPSITDFVMVTVAGLPPADADATPYEVWIVNDVTGQRLRVGDPIRRLNPDGGAAPLVQNARDLSDFHAVEVTDARGAVVLRGEVGPEAIVASPSP
jgi:Putative zinc-finger